MEKLVKRANKYSYTLNHVCHIVLLFLSNNYSSVVSFKTRADRKKRDLLIFYLSGRMFATAKIKNSVNIIIECPTI